ncbi:BamA/OMP85 family outer membrane protein [Haloferula sp.]|uniref:BamA/OMP85 family outer membrane protein n=1 Tax=Haloferula sp. TaxID=2497595 RepID=UPI00329F2553
MCRLLTILLLLASMPVMVAKTELQLTGMTSISEEDVRRLIGGRLEHIENQPASPARASDSAFMIEQLFRKNGFNDASVAWKVRNPNLIHIRITEGPRDTLATVDIEGIADEKERKKLEGLFELNPSKRRISSSGDPPFRESDVEAGLSLIKAELKSQGYWEPTVEVKDRKTNSIKGGQHFLLKVDKGRLFLIGNPEFSGKQTEGLNTVIADYLNQPADTGNINGIRLKVTEYYRSKGFINATVRMSIRVGSKHVHPLFNVIEGKRYRLGKVDFVGLEKTNPDRISRRVKTLPNAYIDGSATDKRIRQLIATGAFSTVRLETREGEGDKLDATLHFEEANARGISLTGGFGTYEGAIFGATYHDRNFMGQLMNFSAGGEYTQRSILGDISLTDPWVAGTDAQGKLRLYSLSRNNEGYDNWTTGLEGSISYPVNDHYNWQVTLGIATANTTSDGLPVARLGETNYQNPYLTCYQSFDYRDSSVLPTKGWHVGIPLGIGAAVGNDSTNYFKLGIESSYYMPIGEVGRLGLGAQFDIIIPSGNQLPIDLRLFNGGPRSVRSFPERELGPHDRSGYPIGGQASWVTNIEYIRPVAGALKGVVFLDAGGLSPNWEDFGLDEIEVALGLGLRLDLPIGPVRLEYGHSLTHDPGEPTGTWHFAIGTAF